MAEKRKKPAPVKPPTTRQPTTRSTTTTLPPQATQQQSGDLGALQAQYGVGGTPVMYTEEQSVYLGTTRVTHGPWSAPHPHQQVVPISKANGVIYSWTPEQLIEFQDNLVRAGVVTARDISRGARDATTVRAWQQLVGQSADAYTAGVKVSPLDLLSELTANPLDTGRDRAPLTVTLTNPADLKQGIHDLFRESLGKGALDEDKFDALVAQYQGLQADYQRQQYAAGDTGGTVTAPPDFKTWADEQAKRTDPVAYDSNKVLSQFDVIRSMLAGQGVSNG